jgi:hypothetical protein
LRGRKGSEGITLAGKHTIVHLSRAVAEQLLSSPKAPEWRRVRTLLALTSGMAEGELSGLRMDDLDLDARGAGGAHHEGARPKGRDGLGNDRTDEDCRTASARCRSTRSRPVPCALGNIPDGPAGSAILPSPAMRYSPTNGGSRGAPIWRRCSAPIFAPWGFPTRTRATRSPRMRRAGASRLGSPRRASPRQRLNA